MKNPKHWMSGALPAIRVVARVIEKEKDKINRLNLFPVPDGDTGTNLSLTLANMASDIAKVPRDATAKEMLKAIASSVNNRARGNSGTILAAIISSMAKRLEDVEEITPELLADALEYANRMARESMSNPTEGTMLTVIRDMSIAARKACDDGATDIGDLKRPIVIAAMRATDESAKIMSDILKNKNVGKDAGAFGLSIIVSEALGYFTDGIGDITAELLDSDPEEEEAAFDMPFPENELWEPGTPLYCTEFGLRLKSDPDSSERRAHLKTLSSYGNSEIFIAYDSVAKVHVHTDTPWLVLQHFSEFGEFTFVKSENMRIQTEERQAEIRAQRKPFGIVAVACGRGISELLIDLGATVIVDGGQTNNPEVGEIRQAILAAEAELVVVLPGNKNVISTARKACEMAIEEDGVTGVTIPTTNLPETIAALIAAPDSTSIASNTSALTMHLTSAIKGVQSASITTAVKDYATDTVTAKAGQFISIVKDEIVFAHKDILKILELTLANLITDNSSLITLYLGADFSASRRKLGKIIADFANNDIQFEIVQGDQPVYHLIISVE